MLTTLRPKSPNGKYIIKKGDSLSKIANNEYGDMSIWEKIASENKIRPPHKIFVGQVLRLPVFSSSSTSNFIPGTTFPSKPLPTQQSKLVQKTSYSLLLPEAKPICNPTLEFNSEKMGNYLIQWPQIPMRVGIVDYIFTITLEGIFQAQKKGVSCNATLNQDALKLDAKEAQKTLISAIGSVCPEYNFKSGTLDLTFPFMIKSNTRFGSWTIELDISKPPDIQGSYEPNEVKFTLNDFECKAKLKIKVIGKPKPNAEKELSPNFSFIPSFNTKTVLTIAATTAIVVFAGSALLPIAAGAVAFEEAALILGIAYNGMLIQTH